MKESTRGILIDPFQNKITSVELGDMEDFVQVYAAIGNGCDHVEQLTLNDTDGKSVDTVVLIDEEGTFKAKQSKFRLKFSNRVITITGRAVVLGAFGEDYVSVPDSVHEVKAIVRWHQEI